MHQTDLLTMLGAPCEAPSGVPAPAAEERQAPAERLFEAPRTMAGQMTLMQAVPAIPGDAS